MHFKYENFDFVAYFFYGEPYPKHDPGAGRFVFTGEQRGWIYHMLRTKEKVKFLYLESRAFPNAQTLDVAGPRRCFRHGLYICHQGVVYT